MVAAGVGTSTVLLLGARLLSGLGVYLRDLPQLVNVSLSVLMFECNFLLFAERWQPV